MAARTDCAAKKKRNAITSAAISSKGKNLTPECKTITVPVPPVVFIQPFPHISAFGSVFGSGEKRAVSASTNLH